MSGFPTIRPLGRASESLSIFARHRRSVGALRLTPAVQDEARADPRLPLLFVVPEGVCDFQFLAVPFCPVGRYEPHEHALWSPSAIVPRQRVIGNKSSERYYSVERPIMEVQPCLFSRCFPLMVGVNQRNQNLVVRLENALDLATHPYRINSAFCPKMGRI